MAKLELHVVSPEREVFAGEADMVIAKGVDGDVGILAGHAPMLISLAVAPVRVKEGNQERTILVDGGFLHVSSEDAQTRVEVLAEHADLPEEVDVAAAKAEVERLRAGGDAEDARVKAELARALMLANHGEA